MELAQLLGDGRREGLSQSNIVRLIINNGENFPRDFRVAEFITRPAHTPPPLNGEIVWITTHTLH